LISLAQRCRVAATGFPLKNDPLAKCCPPSHLRSAKLERQEASLQGLIGQGLIGRKLIGGALAACLVVGAGAAVAQEVGKVGVDWLGNDIIVEAIKDPKVEGVTCHVSYFDRGVIDRLQKGNWFEDPSDSSIACRQTGPITIGDIDMSEAGEEVFKQGISLIWKKQVVNRIYDKTNETLIYLSHSRQVQDGSAKMSVTTVPLYGQNVMWTNGKPK
jgi:CreA protein